MSAVESPAPIKTEPEEETCDVVLDYDEARIKLERALLYIDYEVKDEMVIGPTETQSPLPVTIRDHEMSLEKSPVPIKAELVDEACNIEFEYDEVYIKAEQALLYAGHQIKYEMVIGPTEIRRPPPGVDHSHWKAVRRELPNAGVDKEVAFLQRLYGSKLELRNIAHELLCARCGQWSLTKERRLKHQQTACIGNKRCTLELRDAADELLCVRCGQWSLTTAELYQHQRATHVSTEHPRDYLQPNLGNSFQTVFTDQSENTFPVSESAIKAEPEDETSANVLDYNEAIKSERALLYVDHEVKDEIVIVPTEIRRPPPGPPKKEIRPTESEKEHQLKTKIPRTIAEDPNPSTSLATNETSEVKAPKPTFTKTQTVVVHNGITDTLLQQNKTVSSIDKYTCDGCGKDFSLKASLIAHLIRHDTKKNKAQRVATQDNGKQKKHSCDICDYTTDCENDVLRHLRIHCEAKPFACTLCPYKGATKRNFSIHLKSHTEGKAHSCSFCEYKSSRKQHMDVHIRTHTGEKPYACTYCTFKCTQKQHLKTHIRSHTGEKPYACTYCTSQFAKQDNLETHIRTHTGERPYACTYCTYKCAQKHNLETHIRTHTREKPYACTYCTYKCAQKHDLEKHIQTHTGEKPYACTYCTYKCAQKQDLERHIRTHTREKPYACTYCTYKCTQKHNLETHIRTHTREKPYACTYCTFKCADKSNLVKHIKIHTGEKR